MKLGAEFFADWLASGAAPDWVESLGQSVAHAWSHASHGDEPRWMEALEKLPVWPEARICLGAPIVGVSPKEPLSVAEKEALKEALMQLHPWRKGPFDLGGVTIDTEWRSDWKWDRIYPSIGSLDRAHVLDIGCGSGYHLWRMLQAGAQRVFGVEPVLLYAHQFAALQHFLGFREQATVAPMTFEAMPSTSSGWDVIISMGVLYHRKDPIQHLSDIRSRLRKGGRLILETLVVEGDAQIVFVPAGRYAQMRNVWCLPSVEAMQLWLEKLRFEEIRLIDENQTSLEEQRSTEWMRFDSLESFLNPSDINLTIEGYPSPRRATWVAHRFKD